MLHSFFRIWLPTLLLIVATATLIVQAQPEPAAMTPESLRKKATKAMNDGNYNIAYETYRKLVLDPAADPARVSADLNESVQALRNLGRPNEVDAYVEDAVALHKGNWRLLVQAATIYLYSEHQGFIVAGKFERGPRRGGVGGRRVWSDERDRVRALQLMQQAMPLVLKDGDKAEAAQFHLSLAQFVLGQRGDSDAWRLQYLTDLTKLPDYDENYPYHYYNGNSKGAPVNADGSPVLHHIPKSWNNAQSDGERWRWCLMQAMELDVTRKYEVQFNYANFLHQQFGVQTMTYAYSGMRGFGRDDEDDDTRKNESGVYEVKTLDESETIARLANGIKRFKLADEFNPIHVLRELLSSKDVNYAWRAAEMLAQIFEDRQQYDKAADLWRQLVANYGNNDQKANWQRRLDQIVKNWGQFEPIGTQAANEAAKVGFRFRNGDHVSFEAFQIDVKTLLNDLKDYIRNKPKEVDWNRFDVNNLGYNLLERDQKYVGEKVAAWEQDLKPRAGHFDRLIEIETPLKKAGAYLVTAKMKDGNVSRIVLWIADTALIKKPLDGGMFYFAADAVSGKPIAKANLEFFGYRTRWVPNDAKDRGGGHYVIDTQNFAEFTDADGQFLSKLPNDNDRNSYQWLITATTPEGRLAYLGFTNIWAGRYYDYQYNQTKTFVITDRPVYRPDQTVKFKAWINHAQYDQKNKSAFAGQKFAVEIYDPRHEKVWAGTLTADEYGGVDGELSLPKDATLGVYQILFINHGGVGTFRVEEYKKPEFEVSVEAPTEPVMLGDKVTATIKANYLFGAPVTEGKVKYKVLRTGFESTWYPLASWDWFYGPGYWWFACDYPWYPGWGYWGCKRPWFPWWGWRPPQQPELVAEAEAPLTADGTVKVEIDTALAKAIHADEDHRYEITAEVTDASRRVIAGKGTVLVSRKPFKVYAWVTRGYYRTGDVVEASFSAQTLDNKPVKGTGVLHLYSVTYGKDMKPVEKEVQRWELPTDESGHAAVKIKAAAGGQYRLSYKVTDAAKHEIEGGYVFTVVGGDFGDGAQFRFNDLELITDKREYAPGEKVQLQINTNHADSTVLLFVRASNSTYLAPKLIALKGKSAQEAIEIVQKDMPNFFIEALTISDGKVYSEVREIVVPPASRVLNVEITPSAQRYKPGEKAKIKIKLTGPDGKPFIGSTALTIYDKAVEYISGGSNVPEIKAFFWKWRRSHSVSTESSLNKMGDNLVNRGEVAMNALGVFGQMVASLEERQEGAQVAPLARLRRGKRGVAMADAAEPMNAMKASREMPMASAPPEDKAADALGAVNMGDDDSSAAVVQPTVRSNFADTALWVASLTTNDAGEGEVELTMPENLTTWKTRVWAMGPGTQVGQGETEVITSKNLIVRLQAPRFFVEKDEVVLSANVHNYLKDKKRVKVVLEVDQTGGGRIAPKDIAIHRMDPDHWSLPEIVDVPANGEARVDWRVKVEHEGQILVRMKALTDEESDAMEMKFPVYVHGMLKMDSFSGVIRPDKDSASVTMKVPTERRPEQSRIEVRYSPTLAGAMVDALPYLVDFPYGCTEQTLNRFLPTVITQQTLMKMGLDLKDIQKKRTNLNAQEIGDDQARANDWKRVKQARHGDDDNPVFDSDRVNEMVKAGVNRLTSMQCSDGGWGWFSGWGEQSYPHTTALVVHGFQVARANDVAIVPGVYERGFEWLKRYQSEQVRLLKNAANKELHRNDYKDSADNLDAFVYMVLVDGGTNDKDMQDFLYRDRNNLAVYAKAMLGLALNTLKVNDRRDMIIQNIEQFLVQDDENQTAYLKLPENNWWWCWYGSENEAQAYYLKLLAASDPKSEKSSRLVKYLINNRRHATYWNSTRDTAIVVEAFADYIKASGEDQPDMTVELWLDGKKQKEVAINKENIFSFDNKLVLEGKDVTAGEHKLELRRRGKGSVYFNAYLTNFTLEDPISKAGLEIKVNRKYYKLVREDKTIKAQGDRGQAMDQKVEKYRRELIPGPFDPKAGKATPLKSGDLIEIELEVDSKNDYEYIMLEDMKAAGLEPVEVRSGYNGNELGAYMELRDERVTLFCRTLPRGKSSVTYRMRAEIPGVFSALPTRASAMYAPELRANSDEMKVTVED